MSVQALQAQIAADISGIKAWEQAHGDDPTLDQLEQTLAFISANVNSQNLPAATAEVASIESVISLEEMPTDPASIQKRKDSDVDEIAAWEKVHGDNPQLVFLSSEIQAILKDGGQSSKNLLAQYELRMTQYMQG